ncbi:MAG TPA: hypothetical protein VIW46_12650 [Acidimicrobiia bacterium]|jgi:dipeptide/tripeptide permease
MTWEGRGAGDVGLGRGRGRRLGSVLVTEVTRDEVRGTALTLQTALGFLLTLVTIRLTPVVADAVGWRWGFAWLAAGPAVGLWAMVALRATRLNPDT